jgi:hypothetical protein
LPNNWNTPTIYKSNSKYNKRIGADKIKKELEEYSLIQDLVYDRLEQSKENDMATNKATNKVKKVFRQVGLRTGAVRRATEVGKRHASKYEVPPAHYSSSVLRDAYKAGLQA